MKTALQISHCTVRNYIPLCAVNIEHIENCFVQKSEGFMSYTNMFTINDF